MKKTVLSIFLITLSAVVATAESVTQGLEKPLFENSSSMVFAAENAGEDFQLGGVATLVDAFSQEGAYFVLRGNAATEFESSSGSITYGTGPVYMLGATQYSYTATIENVVKFIPFGTAGHLVYWPALGLFLKDSGSEYNGLNGWQYTTSDVNEAALVEMSSLPSGCFELYYYSLYKKTETASYYGTLYMGADMRDGTISKIKTFAPEKKAALEQGDYTQGYGLPMAFNWSVFTASVGSSAADFDALVLQNMRSRLLNVVSDAKIWLQQYGDYDGLCLVGEDVALSDAITSTESMLATSATYDGLVSQSLMLDISLKEYMRIKLDIYRSDVEALLANSNFSDVFIVGSYPETSRDLLYDIDEQIDDVDLNIGIYTVDALEAKLEELAAGFAGFYSTKMEEIVLPKSYDSSAGLPGELLSYGGYYWSSPLMNFTEPISTLRVLFKETINQELFNDYPMVNLAEFELYDGEGVKVSLSESNFSTNSQEFIEGDMANICDGSLSTFWHSAWSNYSSTTTSGYVYLDITLPSALQSFSFVMYGRDSSLSSKFPTVVLVTTPMNALAVDNLQPFVEQAYMYKEKYGDFDGKYTGEAITTFEAALAAAETVLYSPSPSSSDIFARVGDLSGAIKNYVACKLDVYKFTVDSLFSGVEFSAYPQVGCYSESSRAILESINTTIEDAQRNLDVYTVETLEELYLRIDADFATFYSSKTEYLSLPLTYGSVQGLPGVQLDYGGYMWESPLVKLKESMVGVRIEFISSTTDATYEGYPVIALAEVEIYDAEGNIVLLDKSFFATNSQEMSEGALKNLCDGDNDTYWQSAHTTASATPASNVYLDVLFPSLLDEYTIVLYGRNDAQYTPSEVTITTIKEAAENKISLNGEVAYIYMKNGGVEAYSVSDIDGGYYVQGSYLSIPLNSGDVKSYQQEDVDSISTYAPSLPEFTSYKFNNKFNPNLHVDAVADSIESEMNFSLNSIGKWLTASFQLSDDKAVVYIDSVQQHSKKTRQSFATPKTYTVTYPGYKKYTSVKVSDEVWESVEGAVTRVALTADMLSTNKPSVESNEGVENLLDGDSNTIFHSTWGSANNATLNVNTYITVNLPSALKNIRLYYQCRPQNGYAPLELKIYASNDGHNWSLARTLTTADGLPVGTTFSAVYTSPTISLGDSYSYLKIEQTSGEYSKNHMALAEMRIYDVELGDSTLVSEAVYETKAIPFGREYKVSVDWLVDNAVSVPRIDIDIDGGETVTSKDYYLNANFRIKGYGVYEDFEDSVQIKGRGNTTWGYPKKPYRLKFDTKVKPFGLTKGKSWVLLANYQTNSMLANAVAMKIGQMVGAEYTNHIIPVELYINGEYAGSYMFSEKVGMANNSVDVDEDLGYLLELDTYYDEAYKFRSSNYALPVNIKEPDLSEYTATAATTRKGLIQADFNNLDATLYKNLDISGLLDLDAFARFMLANDLVCNQEIGHPKSTYLFKEELENADSKIKFGPLWDFDWAFGYETTRNYGIVDYSIPVLNSSMSGESGYAFFSAFMNNTDVQKYYYKVWTEFLNKNSIEELKDYMDCYYNFAKSSFDNNAMVWSGEADGAGYATINNNMKQWLNSRASHIYTNLDKYSLDEFNYPAGDVDRSGTLTVRDVALTTAYSVGSENSSFTFDLADMDDDNQITSTDIAAIETVVLDADFLSPTQYYETLVASSEIKVEDFALTLYEDYSLPITVQRAENENFKGLQMDIIVPEGVMLYEASSAAATANHTVVLTQRDMSTYRLLIYSKNNKLFATDSDVIATLVLNAYSEVAPENCSLEITNVLAVNRVVKQFRMGDVEASFNFASELLQGDINSDGVVDVADVTKLVSIILGTQETSTIADVNDDGAVDVADVTKLVTIILGTDSASGAPKRAASRNAVASVLSATEKGGVLSVEVANPSYAFSAVQFDLQLPEGIEVTSRGAAYDVALGHRATAQSHTAPACALRSDGTYRVMIFSLSNDNFADAAGEVATVDLNLDGVPEGEYEYEIKNVTISSLGSKESLAPHKGVITVKSGIEGSIVEGADEDVSAPLYDLSGRRVNSPLKHGIYIKGNKKYIAE